MRRAEETAEAAGRRPGKGSSDRAQGTLRGGRMRSGARAAQARALGAGVRPARAGARPGRRPAASAVGGAA
jgi:hypothetical protein